MTPKFAAALKLIHSKYSEEFDVDGLFERFGQAKNSPSTVNVDKKMEVLGVVKSKYPMATDSVAVVFENFKKFIEMWALQDVDEVWDELEQLGEKEFSTKVSRLVQRIQQLDLDAPDLDLSFRFRNVLREIFEKYSRENELKLDVKGFQNYMQDNKVRRDFSIDLVRFDVFAVHEIKPKQYVTK